MKNRLVVSHHARLRILERLKCKEHKINKVCQKAWNSNIPVDENIIYRKKQIHGSKNSDFRLFNGFIFVFANIDKDTNILITIYNPKKHEYIKEDSE